MIPEGMIDRLLEKRNRIELIKRDRPLTKEEQEQQENIDKMLIRLCSPK